MNRKILCFVLSMFLILGVTTAVSARHNGETVRGRTYMVVPLSEFNPDLEGEAIMRNLNYKAHKTADGQVFGRYTYTLEVFGETNTTSGEVICLKTDGGRAWIGTNILETTDPDLVGQYGWWQVEDNGGSGDRTTFLGFGSLEATLDYCEGPDPNFIFDIDRGQIRVDDGS